jgi:hypothetical protein
MVEYLNLYNFFKEDLTMSKKENNKVEEIEVMNEEEVMETETKETAWTKFKGGAKKHGKKVLGILGAGVAVAVAYGLGKKSAGCDCGDYEDDAIDFEDVNFEDVGVTEE